MSASEPTRPSVGFAGRYVRWLLAHRLWVMLGLILFAALGGYRTAKTYGALRSDIEELLPESAPAVAALKEARARLPGLRHLGVVVDTGGPDNVAAAQRFLDDLAGRIEKYPANEVAAVRVDVKRERHFGETYVLQLMDPKDVRRLTEAVEERRDWEASHAIGTNLLDEDEDPPPKIPVDELKQKYEARYGKAEPFPEDRFIARDGLTEVLVVQAASNETTYESDRELLSKVQRDISDLGFPDAYAPGMRVGFAADVPTRVEEMEGLFRDLSLSGLLVTALVLGSIVWFFRSFRALAILGIPLTFGTFYAFGLVALPPLSITYLNSNTAFLGSIVVGNGINSGIILLARYREDRGRGLGVEDAVVQAVAQTWRPTLAAALAASAAYGSLIFTDFRGFNQFGWIGGFGMVLCWAATYLAAPILIAWLGAHIRPPEKQARGLADRLGDVVLRRSKWVFAVTLGLSVLGGASLFQRADDWLETDLTKLRRRDSWVDGERYWGKRMDATLHRYLTPTVVMAHSPEQAREIERRVRQLQQDQRAGGLVGSVRSIAQVLPPERDKALREAQQLRKVLTPKLQSKLEGNEKALVERALSPEALKPLVAGDVPPVLTAGLREHDGRLDRNVLVFPKVGAGTWDADRMLAFTQDLRRVASEVDPDAQVGGGILLSSDIITAMKRDGPRATAIALLVVLLICVVAFRSFRLSALAVVSLSVGVLLMLGAMALSHQKLNFSNFVALPITFGIAADYSINVLKRFQFEAGKPTLERVRGAVAHTGGAVALCSVTTIIGFGSLLVAQNQALFSFGLFAVAGEIACLGTAVLSLPSAIAWLGSRRSIADAGA
ncbi:MAG: MMPL family transporter [Polyangiaceae bacterium]